jgi:hypothetical protein
MNSQTFLPAPRLHAFSARLAARSPAIAFIWPLKSSSLIFLRPRGQQCQDRHYSLSSRSAETANTATLPDETALNDTKSFVGSEMHLSGSLKILDREHSRQFSNTLPTNAEYPEIPVSISEHPKWVIGNVFTLESKFTGGTGEIFRCHSSVQVPGEGWVEGIGDGSRKVSRLSNPFRVMKGNLILLLVLRKWPRKQHVWISLPNYTKVAH